MGGGGYHQARSTSTCLPRGILIVRSSADHHHSSEGFSSEGFSSLPSDGLSSERDYHHFHQRGAYAGAAFWLLTRGVGVWRLAVSSERPSDRAHVTGLYGYSVYPECAGERDVVWWSSSRPAVARRN